MAFPSTRLLNRFHNSKKDFEAMQLNDQLADNVLNEAELALNGVALELYNKACIAVTSPEEARRLCAFAQFMQWKGVPVIPVAQKPQAAVVAATRSILMKQGLKAKTSKTWAE